MNSKDELKHQIKLMTEYAQMMLDRKDYHGLWDAAIDLQRLEDKLLLLCLSDIDKISNVGKPVNYPEFEGIKNIELTLEGLKSDLDAVQDKIANLKYKNKICKKCGSANNPILLNCGKCKTELERFK